MKLANIEAETTTYGTGEFKHREVVLTVTATEDGEMRLGAPKFCSGIRVGTDMRLVAQWLAEAAKHWERMQ